MKKVLLICALLVLVALAGCVETNGGVALDPNVVAKVETTTETALSIATILGAIWPAIIPFVTAAGGIYGTWLKVKPKLLEEQSRAMMYANITKWSVKTIEDFKAANPEKWEELEKKYWTDIIGKEAENVIRELRGLPPKA